MISMNAEYLEKRYVQKRQNLRFLRLIQEMLFSFDYQPALALDIGGADGYLAGRIKELYPSCAVINLDINREFISQGRSIYPEVHHVHADFLEWKTDLRFDLIISSNVFHWFGTSWHRAIEKVYELLEEGGWFFLHQGGKWTYLPLYETARRVFNHLSGKDIDYTKKLFYPTQKKLLEELSKAGFKVLFHEKRIETQDYTQEELYSSFTVAGLHAFLEEIEDERRKEVFKEVFLKVCEEDDVPVFAVRHYCVMRKPLRSLYIRTGSVDEIVPLLEEVDKEFYPPLTERNSSIGDYLRNVRPDKVFVAWHPVHGIVGCACMGIKSLPFTSAPVPYLSTIAVKKPFRRLDVARRLYGRILDEFPELYTRTWSFNFSHKKLLERFGFKKVYVVENDRGEGVHTEYWAREVF